MNLQDLDSYLNYLIHLSNELLNKKRIETKDIVTLQNEWNKFQSVVPADAEIADSLKISIKAIQISKIEYPKEYGLMGTLRETWKTIVGSASIWFFFLINIREAEKNRQLIMEFRHKLSHLFFEFGKLGEM